MKKNGFTFVETLLVVAIISALSVFGMIRISEFQKQATIDSAANELLTTLKVARSKSENGEIPEGKTLNDYESDGIPFYGVRSTGDGYEIFMIYKDLGASSETTGSVGSSFEGSDKITFSSFDVRFNRLTGETGGTNIDVFYKGIAEKIVEVNSAGYFEVKDKV